MRTARNIGYGLLFSICGARCMSGDNEIVFSINGDNITREELVAQMNIDKATVFDFFQKKYQLVYHPGFWTTPHDGETPLQKLKAQAIKQLTGIYVKRQLAVELRVLHSSTYEDWLKSFDRENNRRAAGIANGEVIYGPAHFDLTAYTGYYLSNLENQMKEAISQQPYDTSAEVLQYVYEENKESMFRVIGDIEIEKITATRNRDQQKPPAGMSAVVQHIHRGQSFKAAAEKEGFLVTTQWLTAATKRADRMYTPRLWQTIQSMRPGEVSAIFEENGEYRMVRLLQKEADTYKSLPEVKEWLMQKLLEDRYQSLLREREQAAHIKITEAAMEKLIWPVK